MWQRFPYRRRREGPLPVFSSAKTKRIPSRPRSGIGGTSLVYGQPFCWKYCFFRRKGGAAYIGEERSGAKGKAAKKFSGNFACLSGVLIEQSVSRGQNRNFFCGKCLTVGSKRRIKPFAPTSWPRPKGRREKKFSRMAKKVLDAGLKMRHKSPSRQRVAPTGPRKKTFAK